MTFRHLPFLAAMLLLSATDSLHATGGHAADDELALAAAQLTAGVTTTTTTTTVGAPAGVSVTATLADPTDCINNGSWSGVISWTPHIPVSASNLPDGRILTFASNQRTSFPGGPEFTYAATWNPATGAFQEFNNTTHDMFCGGITLMPDGRVMVNGGRNEVTFTSVFDWRTNTWTRIQNMNAGRWYNTSVSLPNGNVFTATGGDPGVGNGTKTTERWSSAGWTLMSGIGWPAVLGSDAGYFTHWHPFVSLAPDGRLLHFGPTDTMHWFNVTGTGSFVNANAAVPGAHYPKEGCWVMYDEGKVLVAGGGATTTASAGDTSIGTSTNLAYTVNMNTNPPTVSSTASMQYPRQFANTVVLPSGEVLVMGGNSPGQKFSDAGSILPCEIWNPKTGTWRTVASISVPRNYHSLALLLPDGRVLSGGGGLGGGDHQDAQLYNPPCFYTSTGALAPRPVLNTAPTKIGPGSTFSVTGTAGLVKFSLIRMAALTHSVNTDQRYLSLPFTETSSGNYNIVAHSNVNVLNPGFWMLYGVNSTGAFSVAKIIQVDAASAIALDNPGDKVGVVGTAASVQLTANVPVGATATYSATGLPAGLTINSSTGFISGTPTTAGTFTVQVVATGSPSTAGSSSQTFTWIIYASANQRTFTTFSGATGITFNGSAAISGSALRLTTAVGNLAGSAFLTLPVGITADTSFSTRFNFRTGGGNGADGLTFTVQGNSANVLGSAGGGLGYAGVGKSLSVMFNEYSGNTIGVLTNGDVNTRLATYVPGFSIQDNVSHTAWVEYDGVLNTLKVYLSQTATTTRPATPIITVANIDLSTLVGSTGWIGFTGGTGGATNNHDVETWDLSVIGTANRAPTVTNPGTRTNVVGTALTLPVAATDPDGDTLAYSATGLPTGLTISSTTGVISGTPTATGSFNTVVSVTDNKNPAVTVSFTWTINAVVNLNPVAATTTTTSGTAITYTASSTGGVNVRYQWNWGDGSATTAYSTTTTASHTYAAPGRYTITLTATDDTGRITTYTFYQAINAALTALRPTASSSIVYEARTTANSRLWTVNQDNNSVSVFDAVTRSRLAEINVGTAPRTLALAPNGNVWVSNIESSTVSIISGSTLAVVQTITLPRGSRPFGIAFSPNGADGWIACEGTGLLLRMNPSTGAQVSSLNIAPDARHVSVSADSSRVFVTRFITPPLPGENTAIITTSNTVGAEVYSITVSTLAVQKSVLLHSDRLDSEKSGRGIPNYLGPAIVSPDGLTAWVPSKQDNVKRGKLRDGSDLVHDQTIRSVVSRIPLTSGAPAATDDSTNRVDFDNAGIAVNGAFEAKGIYLFTALEGSREVGIVDVWNKKELTRFSAGRAPQGIAVSPDGRTVYVQNFMDRTITVHDVGAILDGRLTTPTLSATLSCITTERLAANVLLGKKHFYDSADRRIAFEQYISCASCHNDGAQDGRVWDFTGFGEGLRNTITLRGHGGTAQGPVHWSGNFDEIQDFENQIHTLPLGTGLITTGSPNPPLGAPNAGRSTDLDALAAYVTSLSSNDPSPARNTDGSLTASAAAGKIVFVNQNCTACHSGAQFTDSAVNVLHDVGTLKAASGTRLGASLTGLDTPTLRGLFNTAPYLHDGSAASLEAAILAHTTVPKPTAGTQAMTDLVNYLKAIDASEVSPTPNNFAVTLSAPATATAPYQVNGTSALFNYTDLSLSDFVITNGTASNLVTNAAAGTFSITVTATTSGTVTVQLPAGTFLSNGASNLASNVATTSYTIPNRAPVVTTPATQSTVRGTTTTLQIVASDPDGNTLTYSATGLPAGLTINSSTGLISGTVSSLAVATSTVVVTVSDGSLSATASFTWNTTAPVTGPTFNGGDIGGVAATGSTSVSGGVYTVKGSGDNIYYIADSCYFTSTPVTGDADIRARLTSMTNSGAWAKAGVMIRETTAAGSRHAATISTPAETAFGFDMLYRLTTDGTTADSYYGNPNPVPNNWMRLTRVGDVITSYVSANGTTWTQIGVATYSGLPATMLYGLAVTSYNNGTLCTATFDNVQIIGGTVPTVPAAPTGLTATAQSSSAIALAWTDMANNETSYRIDRAIGTGAYGTLTTLPAGTTSYTDTGLTASTGYSYKVSAVNAAGAGTSGPVSATTQAATGGGLTFNGADIGAVLAAGSTTTSGGIYTVKGSGDNIYYTADSCQFASTAVTGDADIRARLTSMTNTGAWAKAGVMIRETTAAGARMAFTCSTPAATGNGFDYVYRTTSNAAATDTFFGSPNPEPNNWVRLTRVGNVITSYVSANGTAWSQVNAITYTSLPTTMLYGLAVTSYNNGTLCTATFDNVQIIGGTAPTVPAAPTGLAASNVPTGVSLSWTDVATNETSYRIERATGAGSYATIATLAAGASSYIDTSVAPSTGYSYRVSAVNAAGAGSATPVTITTPASTGLTLIGADIGSVAAAGSTTGSGSSFTVKGSGDNIYYIADSFHFASTAISGDADIRARLTSMTNSGDWAKAGVMIRETSAPGARHAAMISTPAEAGFGFDMLYRTAADGTTADTYYGNPNPVPNNWMRLTRVGNVITSYVSANGTSWTLINSITYTSLPTSMQYGLAVTSYNNGTLCTATFDNVQITTGAVAPLASRTTTTLSTSSVSTTSSATSTLSTSQDSSGSTSLAFTRPAGSSIQASLQIIDDLAQSPAGWRTSTIRPTIISNGDGTETLSFTNLSTAFTGKQGFARIHIEQDINGDGFADVEQNGEVFGFTRRSYPVGTATAGNAFALPPLVSGQVTSVNAATITLNNKLPALSPGNQYYLEVISGMNQGHRFDLNEASLNGSSISVETANLRNTLSTVPASLVGDIVVIRAHQTVGSLFPERLFTGSSTPTMADRLMFYNGTGYETLWLMRKPDGTQVWLRQGDASLANAGSRVVDVTEGAMIQTRSKEMVLTNAGLVRSHRIALPLKTGTRLVASVTPGAASLTSLGMIVANGFTASTSASTADRVDFLASDDVTTATGYRSVALLASATSAQWTDITDTTMTNLNAVALVKPMRAFFIKSTTAKPGFMVPATWRP